MTSYEENIFLKFEVCLGKFWMCTSLKFLPFSRESFKNKIEGILKTGSHYKTWS